MRALLIAACLAACAPHHILRTRTEPPTWKYVADFAAMGVGMALCADGYNRKDDAELAVGCGGFLMFFAPYWVVNP